MTNHNFMAQSNNKSLSSKEVKSTLAKMEAIMADFRKELARFKAERIQIINKINKKADDRKIQEILRRIK